MDVLIEMIELIEMAELPKSILREIFMKTLRFFGLFLAALMLTLSFAGCPGGAISSRDDSYGDLVIPGSVNGRPAEVRFYTARSFRGSGETPVLTPQTGDRFVITFTDNNEVISRGTIGVNNFNVTFNPVGGAASFPASFIGGRINLPDIPGVGAFVAEVDRPGAGGGGGGGNGGVAPPTPPHTHVWRVINLGLGGAYDCCLTYGKYCTICDFEVLSPANHYIDTSDAAIVGGDCIAPRPCIVDNCNVGGTHVAHGGVRDYVIDSNDCTNDFVCSRCGIVDVGSGFSDHDFGVCAPGNVCANDPLCFHPAPAACDFTGQVTGQPCLHANYGCTELAP